MDKVNPDDRFQLDIEKHARVAKALEQINSMKFRYLAPPKEVKKLILDGTSLENDRKDATNENEEKLEVIENDDSILNMTLNEHIKQMLRKTRTIALLRIATSHSKRRSSSDEEGSEEVSEEEVTEYKEGDEQVECDLKEQNDDVEAEMDAFPSLVNTVVRSRRKSLEWKKKRLREFQLENESPELLSAAKRLTKTLSSYLNLPTTLSYQDLEMITESLLNETYVEQDEYDHLVNLVVDTTSDDDDESTESHEHMRLSRREMSAQIISQLQDEASDEAMEGHHRQGFVRQMSKLSMSGHKMSMHEASRWSFLNSQEMKSYSSLMSNTQSLEYTPSMQNIPPIQENEQLNELPIPIDPNNFSEDEYHVWREEVLDDYLAWLNAKIEKKTRLKSKRRTSKVPRWLMLYNAGKRPRGSVSSDTK